MPPNDTPLPVVTAGPLPRAARAALRRAGARLLRADDADLALTAALEHDALFVVAAPAQAAAGGGELARLLAATGRADDLLVLAPGADAAARRVTWRGLARRLRARARERRRIEAAFAARPGWDVMLAAYRAHLRERLAELARARDAGDAGAALAIVHDIKGTAGGYGLGQLTAAAREAQDHFLAGEPAAGFGRCDRLLQQAAVALAA